MFKITKSLLKDSNVAFKILLTNKRPFWAWINIIFNRIDEDRLKKFGPDRTCAEWLLRNGAAVKFRSSPEFIHDYNDLPLEGTKVLLEEVDATESSIMHHGFDHFVGCKFIKTIKLHKCKYLQNEALGMMSPLNQSLLYLQVSSCHNINSEGLKQLSHLVNLKELILFDFPYVKDKDSVKKYLQSHLKSCVIYYDEEHKSKNKVTF